jgi:integrating conjugative element membrane protein (TIGR03747 family)
VASNVSFPERPFGHAILWPFKWLWTASLGVFFGGLFIMALHIIAAHIWWDAPDRVAMAQEIFDKSSLATTDAGIVSANTVIGHLLSDGAYWLFFKLTYVHQAMEHFASGAALNKFDAFYRDVVIIPHRDDILVGMHAIQTVSIRMAVILSAIPLLGIAYSIGLIDGIVGRYIRTKSAGRESSSLYHRAKYLQLMGVSLGTLIYLCAPFHIDPRLIVLPIALLTGLIARLQWMFYKKYL